MIRSLHEGTAALPDADGQYVDSPQQTVDAIVTGCQHALAGAVERLYRMHRGGRNRRSCACSRAVARRRWRRGSASRSACTRTWCSKACTASLETLSDRARGGRRALVLASPVVPLVTPEPRAQLELRRPQASRGRAIRSGPEIAAVLGLARGAVVAGDARARGAGAGGGAGTGRGYRSPRRSTRWTLRRSRRLDARARAIGLEVLDECASTNAVLAARAACGRALRHRARLRAATSPDAGGAARAGIRGSAPA